MTDQSCPRFNSCCAPLCPNDAQSLKHGCWYADEDVCRCRPAPDWVKAQKKIRKKLGMDVDLGYFTYAMLQAPGQLRPETKGIDPDSRHRKSLEQKWIKAHGKAKITPQ